MRQAERRKQGRGGDPCTQKPLYRRQKPSGPTRMAQFGHNNPPMVKIKMVSIKQRAQQVIFLTPLLTVSKLGFLKDV
jgi:hypothetical protein